MRSRKAHCQAPLDNPGTGDTYEYHSRERRSCGGQKIVYSTKTYTGGAAAAAAMRVYTYVCIQARPISTNPGSVEEECKYGLPSGTCFTARRLEVVVVAELLWIYFVARFFFVCGGISCLFFVFFLSNAHGLLQVRGNHASCTSLLVSYILTRVRPYTIYHISWKKIVHMPGTYDMRYPW